MIAASTQKIHPGRAFCAVPVMAGDKAFHVWRRLTPAEQALVGPVLDIRHLPEARERLLAVAAAQPAVHLSWLLAEIERH